jgi:GT2 family glycosyltransferase
MSERTVLEVEGAIVIINKYCGYLKQIKLFALDLKMEDLKKTAHIIIPVHNRRETTLRCLRHLKEQLISLNYNIVVIDDGSTDGTSEAIKDQYPEVFLIKGDGQLWWAGAICLGMKHAYQTRAEYFFWMNDDTLPTPGTLQLMLEQCSRHPNLITCAQSYKDDTLGQPTYGGHKKKIMNVMLFHTPQGEIYPCDCMSGNLVCFPRSVIDKIGLPPCDELPHNMADVVYTWNAKKAGFQLIVCGDATAICEMNPYEEGLGSSSIPMNIRWRILNSYKSNLYPPAFWYYCQSFYGSLAPIVFIKSYLSLLLLTILRAIFPLHITTKITIFKEKVFRSNSGKILRESQSCNTPE